MPVPDFTENGLLPPGIHACSLLEAADLLCSNDHRATVWAGFLAFLGWAQALPVPTAFLVDGSYVTDKALPKDIDVVVDLTGCTPANQLAWMQAFADNHDTVKADFHVDFYPFAVGVGSDFSAFFQYIRVDEALKRGIPTTIRKGILRVLP